MSVVYVCSRCNILIRSKIIEEMPGSVASGTHCITLKSPDKPLMTVIKSKHAYVNADA